MSGEFYRLASRIKHRFGLHNRQRHYSIAPRCDWCGHRSTEQKAIARRNRAAVIAMDARADANPAACKDVEWRTPGGAANWFRRKPKHRHEWVRVGYGGAGWSHFRCACGETEIDA